MRIVMHLLSKAIDAPTWVNIRQIQFEQTQADLISEGFQTLFPGIPRQSERNITPRHERIESHPSHPHDTTQAPLPFIKIVTAPTVA